jgi:protein-S-isoprenylcysteine O-methyltransferase Ste14
MYVALLLHGAGQALVVANVLCGPLLLVAFGVLFALRVGPEERMMRETFGAEYDAYAGRTRRFLP